jgi:hypothetical protein
MRCDIGLSSRCDSASQAQPNRPKPFFYFEMSYAAMRSFSARRNASRCRLMKCRCLSDKGTIMSIGNTVGGAQRFRHQHLARRRLKRDEVSVEKPVDCGRKQQRRLTRGSRAFSAIGRRGATHATSSLQCHHRCSSGRPVRRSDLGREKRQPRRGRPSGLHPLRRLASSCLDSQPPRAHICQR